jgi:hypothetical protein
MRAGSFLFMIGLAAIVACSSEDPGVDGSSQAIVAKVMANTAKVEPDRLTFPKTSITQDLRDRIQAYARALADGKKKEDVENVILIGDRQDNATDSSGRLRDSLDNPYGYLRRGTSIHDEGNRTVIMTEEATLEEAVKELDAHEVIDIAAYDPVSGDIKPQTVLNKKLNFTIPVIDVSDKDLWRDGPAFIRIATANVHVDTSVDLGVNIGLFKVNEAHAIIDANVESELKIEAGGEQSFSKKPETKVFGASWPIGSIGPIPVTLNLDTFIGCDFGVDGRLVATTGAKASLKTHGGISYDRNSGTHASFNPPDFTPTLIPPTVDTSVTASARCYVRPELSLLLAGMAGPLVAPEGYAKLSATILPPPLKASVNAGVTVDVGGKLSVFGRDLAELPRAQVFAFDKEIWSSGGSTCGTGKTVGAIDAKYQALGGCNSVLGAPTSDEMVTPDNIGRYNVFEHGSIYWTQATGAWEVHGTIRDKYKDLGWEASALGYPVSDEGGTPDGKGRYNAFQNGSIYWTQATGAHEVHGAIRDKWRDLGWEAGVLGYPTSDEHDGDHPGARSNDFQGGSITYDPASGSVSVSTNH